MIKEEYLKKHKVSEKSFLIYCVNALVDESIRDDDNINDLKGFLYDLITEYYKGIENLDEMIKIQKNNLTSNYMIGLFNGLILAKGIIENVDVDKLLVECKEDNPSLKFEDLKEDMWVWDNYSKEYKQIAKIDSDKMGIWYHGIYTEYEADIFEENRFYRKEVRND